MAEQHEVSVGIVDNDVLVLDALCQAISRYRAPLRIMWATVSANLALEYCQTTSMRPQVVLTDMEMPELSGVELARALSQMPIPVPAVGITAFDESLHAPASGSGLSSVLAKETPLPMLVRALGEAAGDSFAAHWSEPIAMDNPLSDMECRILQLYAQGQTTEAIGRQLHISATTAKTHAQRAFRKLHAHGRTEAIAVCVSRGWIL